MANEWIEWGGGGIDESPVALGTEIEIRFRGDSPHESWPSTNSRGLEWNHDGGAGDIIAYRLVGVPQPANDNLTPRAQFDAASPLQEELAINISAQIANGVRPDAVQVLEWANALYEAEVGAA